MLNYISSYATIVLFLFYFIGRAIAISREKKLFRDNIRCEDVNKSNINFNNKYDIVDSFCVDDYKECFILTSQQGIYNLSLYEIEYDDEWYECGKHKVFNYEILNIGQSLEFDVTLTECIPNYKIVYYGPDYKETTIELIINGKNGVPSESVYVKNTLRSFLYRMVL